MSRHQGPSEKQTSPGQGDIAIIGMSCLLPGAPDLHTYWHNILTKFDAITDPPREAWDADVFYSADSKANDRVYCKRGGFLGPIANFNPLKHGVMPSALEGSEPDQWLALEVARAAFDDAGYTGEIPERHRTAVILGKGTYLNRGNLTAAQHGQVVDQTLAILRKLNHDYTEADLQVIRQDLKSCLPPFNTDTAQGLIPNVTVGRIANRLDLMGPSYTVDAACASSLVAIDIARRDLLSGQCDLALVGGMHVVTPVPVLMLFCQLGALSHQQQIRPFDKEADGTILSEGVAMAVLKRREDAERDGNRIYALIKGAGIASDGRALSVLAPRVEGEERALRLAYEQAGVSPGSIGLIEAHGTATLVGDATEIQAMTRVLGGREGTLPRVALGTIKSMIGHTMPAAGMAGVIKTSLALYHKTLPPTLNVAKPSPRLELEKTPFYINTETRPWIHGGSDAPRRAGVNSFGFGGINGHVVLEEYPAADERTSSGRDLQWETELCVLQGETRADLIREGQRLQSFLAAAPSVTLKDLAYTLNVRLAELNGRAGRRLACVASSVDDLQRKLTKALDRLADPACHKIKERSGIFFFDEPLGRRGKLAFLFPGEGAQYINMLSDLCLHFPQVRQCFDDIDRVFEKHARGYRPSDFIFPTPIFTDAERAESERRIWQMDVAIEALVTANHALHTLLGHLGIQADAILGHSTGEFSAMRAAGMLETHGYDQRLLKLNERYNEVAARGGIPEATLLAVGAGREQVDAIVAQVGLELFVAMDNCPHQTVVAGSREATDAVFDVATQQGFICERLAFDRAYHTPLYAPYAEVVREVMNEWIVAPPAVPLYSCTTMAPFSADISAIRDVAHQHWIAPVEFRRTVEAMYDDGVRLFVEVGPRGNLTAFVEDILRGRTALAASIDVSRRSGTTQLNHLLGMLAAHAVPMSLEELYARREPRIVDLDHPSDPLHEGKRPGLEVKLGTGWPPMGISDETAARLRSEIAARAPQTGVATPRDQSSVVPAGGHTPPAEHWREIAIRPLDVATGNTRGATNGHHEPALDVAAGRGRVEQNGLHEPAFPLPAGNSYASGNGHHAMTHAVTPLPESTHSTPSPQILTVATQSSGHLPPVPVQPPLVPAPLPTPPTPSVGTSVASPSSEATNVMASYLQTMEQFLIMQQDVVQAYLTGSTVASPIPAAYPQSASATPLVTLPVAAPAPVMTAAPVMPTLPMASLMPAGAAPSEPLPGPATVVAPAVLAEIGAVPVVAAALSATPGLDAAGIGRLLLQIVSDKTGYPSDMLDLQLDLEADLGIDSIKRVEILGSFQQESGLRLGDHMDRLSASRTLQGVIDLLVLPGPVSIAAPDVTAPIPPLPPQEALPAPDNRAAGSSTASAPVPVATAVAASTPDAAAVGRLLLQIVSDKTGYPSNMLDLQLDLEADLGIDSIKRVEILGSFQQESGLRLGDHMDRLSASRTLQGIIDFLVAPDAVAAPSTTIQPGRAGTMPSSEEVSSAFPFLAKIVNFSPGQSLVAEYDLSLQSGSFLVDHTLGRGVSQDDRSLAGLAVMPMTMSMEVLAEAAAALMPGRVVVGMREVRASRWIAIDEGAVTLRINARVTAPDAVHVQIQELEPDASRAGATVPPIVEATVLVADDYPPAPVGGDLPLTNAQPCRWRPEELYDQAMFHGPAFRGVRSVDRVGTNGATATLMTLPPDPLLPGHRGSQFLIDPVLLDQPGQVVGFWAAQQLPRGYLVFPYRLEALHLYHSPFPAHTQLACQARIALLGEHQTRADLDVVQPDGRVAVRFVGWEDRRFDLPRPFYRLLLAPQESILSEQWPELASLLPEPVRLQAYRLSIRAFPDGLLTGHGAIWQKVLARLVLSRRELDLWRSLRTPELRRLEWLLGRVVAKDAIRAYLMAHAGLRLNPADVEILPDAEGRPIVDGAWRHSVGAMPHLSLAHTEGTAIAVALNPDEAAGVGVDLEPIGRMNDAVAMGAFTATEQQLLATLAERPEECWPLRFWCAKEAVAKALGRGMLGGPQALVVERVERESGLLCVGVTGELAQHLPATEGSPLTTYTSRVEDVVVAVSLYGKKERYATKS